MRRTYILLLPFGMPKDPLRDVMTESLVSAGADMNRVMEPPISRRLPSTPGSLPDDNALLENFIQYAMRTARGISDGLLPVIPFRAGGMDPFMVMDQLVGRVPGLRHGPDERRVLLIESMQDLLAFEEQHREKGVISGDLYSGGVLHPQLDKAHYGLWIVMTWCPNVRERFMDCVDEFLQAERKVMKGGIRGQSLPPPEPSERGSEPPAELEQALIRSQPPRRPSSTSLKALRRPTDHPTVPSMPSPAPEAGDKTGRDPV
jgi:hypothetical protein